MLKATVTVHLFGTRVKKVVSKRYAIGERARHIDIIRKIHELLTKRHSRVSRGVPTHTGDDLANIKFGIFVGYERRRRSRVKGLGRSEIALGNSESVSFSNLYLRLF